LRNRRRIALGTALALAVIALVAAFTRAEGHHVRPAVATAFPPHHLTEGFRNVNPSFVRASNWVRVRHFASRVGPLLWGDRNGAALAAATPDLEELRFNGHTPTVTWIGHSTLLVQLDGVNFLTDPHWGSASGPFGGRLGVSRYTPPGIAFEDLPRIDFVLISHDHYDHLDEPTVVRLAQTHNPRFVVPLGVKAWLADRGITNAIELDWGEAVDVQGLKIVCTPAQHFSGRTLRDQGRRLWSSWVVLGSKRFYFGGDSGYAGHFKDIGAAYGPFDLAALAIGSYTPRELTRPVHTSPEDALQAWLDVRGTHFVGIHWGTFFLAQEPYDEPPRRLAAEAQRLGLDPEVIWALKPGETRTW
jgi:L-ascorbate metabolism protein UlaG (beta-lactamase superfamily)